MCNHHEAKYTAAKLIFGQRFRDKELLEDGKQSLRDTLSLLRREGMAEYGCLPWFWHWTQAFTCALELAEEPELKQELYELLDELWSLRTSYYLKGAWVGAHSRGWPHDAPRDANVLHDYVQFGDFSLPEEMPRTEYAGFLFHKAPEAKRRLALNRSEPSEVRKVLMKSVDGEMRQLHSYAYVTEHYAAGGLWERVREFDNEQLRWMFSLPIRDGGKANQLYFFTRERDMILLVAIPATKASGWRCCITKMWCWHCIRCRNQRVPAVRKLSAFYRKGNGCMSQKLCTVK